MPNQSKNWCYTLNNPTDEDVAALIKAEEDGVFRFHAYQHETGEAGTKHLQGYVIFSKKVTLTGAKKAIPRAHLEMRKGTHEDALDYVTKEETRDDGTLPYIWGDGPNRGKRSDLDALKKDLDDEKEEDELWENHFPVMLKYYRGVSQYKLVKKGGKRDGSTPTEVQVYWGPPGTGKSTRAAQEEPDAFWLTRDNGNGTIWWDGYTNQSCVIIDEFYGWIKYDTLLRILSPFPFTVQTKGGGVQLQATKFIFTSNKAVNAWYPRIRDTTSLIRRIAGNIHHMEEIKDPYLLARDDEGLPPDQTMVCIRCYRRSEMLINLLCSKCSDDQDPPTPPAPKKRRINPTPVAPSEAKRSLTFAQFYE